MQKFNAVEVREIRVLTTKQIAEAYGADVKTVQYNFRYNKEKYVEGKHYIEIRDDELRRLKTRNEFQSSFKYAKCLYLWTEKGALLHAKSLNTDKAWEAYEYLVDFYFRAKEKQPEIKRPDEPEKRKGSIVVDAPENPAIQKSMQEIRKYLTSIDVALAECNKYCCEENYMRVQNMLDQLWLSLGNKITGLRSITPKLIEKAY